jgi:hypothetical protein
MLTAFSATAVTFMMVMFALERRHSGFIVAFACGCALQRVRVSGGGLAVRRRRGGLGGDRAESIPPPSPGATSPVSVTTEVTITCPLCGTQARETMPEHACQYFYRCTGCEERLKPKLGDGCVFCSYRDTVCPPKQLDQ